MSDADAEERIDDLEHYPYKEWLKSKEHGIWTTMFALFFFFTEVCNYFDLKRLLSVFWQRKKQKRIKRKHIKPMYQGLSNSNKMKNSVTNLKNETSDHFS